ncbi:MAG: hypothetical protein K2G36_01150 [Ruminococcus sp.]|nr:hypothetical protein [Ruminococcus sp.]
MKLKKIVSSLLTVSLMASSVPIASVSAANEPQIYVDIRYDDNGEAKADIIFKNMPPISSGGFHLNVGDGWNLKTDSRTNGIKFDTHDCTMDETGIRPTLKKYGDNDIFILFSLVGNYDLNGRFASISLEKNNKFNPENAKINVEFQSNENASDSIYGIGIGTIIEAESNYSPEMLRAYEYKIGDVNNDGRVNAIDSTLIRVALADNNKSSLTVESIKDNFKTYFPDAICPAAPDASQEGIISRYDADLIMEYYADMSTDSQNASRIGKLDFYEYFR